MREDELEAAADTKKERIVVQALSALPVGFDGKAKGGGVAPGILNAIPASDDEGKRIEVGLWVGIQPDKGPKTNSEQEKSLMEYGIKQGIDKPGETQTFQNHYVDPKKFWQFYVNATNGTVWPLIHSMPNKRSRKADFESLKSVDAGYSEKLMENMEQLIKERNEDLPPEQQLDLSDLTIWAHDYHVFHVPGMIKELAEKSDLEGTPNISFFHHEPWPEIRAGHDSNGGRSVEEGVVYADFSDTEREQFKEILTNLTKADTLGFHTEGDAEGFLATVKNFGVLDQEQLQDLSNRVFVNPIGVPKAVIQQNFLLRAPFLKKGLASDDTLNRELGAPQQEGAATTPSDTRELTDAFAVDYRDRQMTEVADFRKMVTELKKKDNRTPNDEQLIANENGIVNRMMQGGASFHDKMTVSEQVYFDPNKTHINSVQRFDYTKGIREFLEGYQAFLTHLRDDKGIPNPEQQYQFNLVTGKGRSGDAVHEYTQYEQEAKILMEEINNEFPGAIYHFKSGIPNPELPMANAASDILLVSSVADGYVLAGPEILESQIISLEEKMQQPDYNPQVIISDNVGLARDLETMEEKPDRMQLVEPSPEAFTKALIQAHDNREQGVGQGLDVVERELKQISSAIPDSMGTFGKVAFAAMDAAKSGEKTPRQAAQDVRDDHKKVRDDKYIKFNPGELRQQRRKAKRQRRKETIKARKQQASASTGSPFAGLGAAAAGSEGGTKRKADSSPKQGKKDKKQAKFKR